MRATHPDVRPRDIIYTIRDLPSYGYFLLNQSTPIDDNLSARFVKNVTSKCIDNLTSKNNALHSELLAISEFFITRQQRESRA